MRQCATRCFLSLANWHVAPEGSVAAQVLANRKRAEVAPFPEFRDLDEVDDESSCRQFSFGNGSEFSTGFLVSEETPIVYHVVHGQARYLPPTGQILR